LVKFGYTNMHLLNYVILVKQSFILKKKDILIKLGLNQTKIGLFLLILVKLNDVKIIYFC
jgi:hypothetical protein